jgi:hypothetical protein
MTNVFPECLYFRCYVSVEPFLIIWVGIGVDRYMFSQANVVRTDITLQCVRSNSEVD